MQALEFWSGKSLAKAIDILQHITPKLKKASASVGVEFDEYAIMSKKKAKEHKVFGGMIKRAQTCIAGMRRRICKEKLQILTGVVALFVLPKESNMFGPSCKLLGLNPKAKYMKCGLDNRSEFDNFLKLTRDIVPGEMVLCRDGFGELKEKTNQSMTICLESWKFDQVYNPPPKSRMARWEPSLDEYERIERSDTTPQEWKDAIDAFLRSHNHTSPKGGGPDNAHKRGS